MGRQHAAAGISFILLAAGMTWPLLPNLDRAVADAGDPYINIWILDWDWWATFHRPLSLFDANAFHPARYSLAFSENLYGVAVLLFPLRAVGVGPIAAYNVAMLLGFAFSGFAMYLLARRLTDSWPAGIAAGVFYAFVPFRFTHLAHVQHVWGGWLPLLLLALLWYEERPSRGRAAAFAAVFVMNGLTNVHYFFFGSLAVAVAYGVVRVLGRARDARTTPLVVATFLGMLVLLPFFYPYAAVAKLYGMQRSYEEVERYSALPQEWLAGGEHTRLYASLFDEGIDPERRLFPGLLVLVLAAIGVFFATRSARVIALLWVAIGFAGSLGLHFEFHRFLFGGVPGFRAIRAPARWAVIAYIGLAILAAFATAALARRSRWLACAVPLLFVAELWAVPIRWWIVPPEPPPVYRWLAAQPRDTPVVHLPMDVSRNEYVLMLRATAHRQPMVNGVSGFAPPERVALSQMANATPIPDDFRERLRANGVRYAIVHRDFPSAETQRWLERERLPLVARFPGGIHGDWVYAVDGSRSMVPTIRHEPSTIATLDFPPSNRAFDRAAVFSGFALSPHGIRKVDLLFNNRRIRLPATLQEDEVVSRTFPSYPATPKPRFVAWFKERPPGVWEKADVVVEVTDGRGRVTMLESRWFTWK